MSSEERTLKQIMNELVTKVATGDAALNLIEDIQCIFKSGLDDRSKIVIVSGICNTFQQFIPRPKEECTVTIDPCAEIANSMRGKIDAEVAESIRWKIGDETIGECDKKKYRYMSNIDEMRQKLIMRGIEPWF